MVKSTARHVDSDHFRPPAFALLPCWAWRHSIFHRVPEARARVDSQLRRRTSAAPPSGRPAPPVAGSSPHQDASVALSRAQRGQAHQGGGAITGRPRHIEVEFKMPGHTLNRESTALHDLTGLVSRSASPQHNAPGVAGEHRPNGGSHRSAQQLCCSGLGRAAPRG